MDAMLSKLWLAVSEMSGFKNIQSALLNPNMHQPISREANSPQAKHVDTKLLSLLFPKRAMLSLILVIAYSEALISSFLCGRCKSQLAGCSLHAKREEFSLWCLLFSFLLPDFLSE